jgi:hypothetical protein
MAPSCVPIAFSTREIASAGRTCDPEPGRALFTTAEMSSVNRLGASAATGRGGGSGAAAAPDGAALPPPRSTMSRIESTALPAAAGGAAAGATAAAPADGTSPRISRLNGELPHSRKSSSSAWSRVTDPSRSRSSTSRPSTSDRRSGTSAQSPSGRRLLKLVRWISTRATRPSASTLGTSIEARGRTRVKSSSKWVGSRRITPSGALAPALCSSRGARFATTTTRSGSIGPRSSTAGSSPTLKLMFPLMKPFFGSDMAAENSHLALKILG